MSETLPLFVFVTFGLVVWLAVGMFRSRTSGQQEPAEGEGAPPPRKGMSATLKLVLILFVVWLVIDVLSISVLGTNAQNTFHYVPPQPKQQP